MRLGTRATAFISRSRALAFTRSCALLIVFASLAKAQTPITGKVIDPDGKPVANQAVLLHAVQESAGSNVATDTTDASGAFALDVPNTDPKSIYFVAVLYEGALYMGEMLRPPFPAGQDYIVQVGVNPVDLGAPGNQEPATPPPATRSERTAGIFVIVAAIVIIAGLIMLAVRGGRRQGGAGSSSWRGSKTILPRRVATRPFWISDAPSCAPG